MWASMDEKGNKREASFAKGTGPAVRMSTFNRMLAPQGPSLKPRNLKPLTRCEKALRARGDQCDLHGNKSPLCKAAAGTARSECPQTSKAPFSEKKYSEPKAPVQDSNLGDGVVSEEEESFAELQNLLTDDAFYTLAGGFVPLKKGIPLSKDLTSCRRSPKPRRTPHTWKRIGGIHDSGSCTG